MVSPDDRQWGTPLPNGSFTGIIGMLEKNEADIGLGPFTPTYQRSRVASFTKSFTRVYLTILGGGNNMKKPNLFSYILTFGWEIWLFLFISMIVCIVVSSLTEFFLDFSTTKIGALKKKLNEYFWAYLGTIFCESMSMNPSFDSTRIVIAVWWLAVIVLMNGFSGNMKANMMQRPEPDKIQSIKELVTRPHIRPIVMKGTAYETYIKTAPSEEFKKLWDMILDHDGLLLPSEMFSVETLEEVKNGESVYIAEPVTLKYYVGKNCKEFEDAFFYFSREIFYPHYFTVSFRKDLRKDVRRVLDTTMRRILEGEDFDGKLMMKINHEFGRCTFQDNAQQEKTLNMEDLLGIFGLFLMGLGAATVVFVIEFNAKRNKTKILLIRRRHGFSLKEIFRKFARFFRR
ncbi:glutamate receptor ionotropic, kainate 5-like [Centruroides vittatus]|uniref:glutamate receptor ionotropic, kainate 5-like n=1 Tax=Centruroides vittatus TaxID=120091 RepID=UPI00350FEE51